jgi:lipoprotein-releasing system permease protein
MFKPLSVFIGLRYTRSRKKNHFVSFISLSSMLGIGMGVMVLITVLSVMNGFDEEIQQRFFGMAPEITVDGHNERISAWAAVEQIIAETPGVNAVAPFVGAQGLVTYEGQISPVMLTGILPAEEERITHLQDKLIMGNVSSLGHFGMIIGRGLAENLGVMVGDYVTVMVPEASVTPAGMIPRFKRFMIQGIFSAGSGFGFESKLVFIHLNDAQKLMHLGDDVTGFKVKIAQAYDAPRLSDQLSARLGERFSVGNWTQQYGAFFHAVKMEKTMMFLILLLIIAVAAFNLVSSLVMMVNDKQAEIAIMRTLGATPGLILKIFIIQGMMVGTVGTMLGLVSGLLLASNATALVAFLQSSFHIDVLTSNVYWVDYLPSKIMLSDLIEVCVAALFMSFSATLYPAWRASKTIIAEALHYE